MLFNNVEFKAMESSLNALWMRQQVISQNISNYETPNYKAQDLSFEEVFQQATSGQPGKRSYDFRAKLTTDEDSRVRVDGNNVDLDAESLKLYQTYLQSSYLNQKITGQFTNMRYVLNQFGK